MIEELRAVTQRDPTVHAILKRGGTLAECVVALFRQKEELVDEVMRLKSIAPKKVTAPDGTTYVYHCPDELVPEL